MVLEKRECSRCHQIKYHFDSDIVCWDCQRDDDNRKISRLVVSRSESSSEKNIFCPNCGYLNSNDEFYESGIMTCYDCEKDFHVEVEHRTTYSTKKVE